MLRKTLTAPLANWRTLSLWDPPEKYMLLQLLIFFRISALVIFLKFHFRTVPKN